MAVQAKSDTGRQLAREYLESHDAVPAGFCLDQLTRSVIKRAQGVRLPVDADKVERQVCALAWKECTEDGAAFSEKARDILSDAEIRNHLFIDYHLAFEQGDKSKIEALDAALAGGRYGIWVAERLTEARILSSV